MCARAILITPDDELRRIFGLEQVPLLVARYNIAPTQDIAIVREPGKLELVRFGFVPDFAKNPREGARFITARRETIATLPAFRDAFRTRRCIVVVDGFYEWKKDGSRKSQPYFIHRPDHSPMALAGIWNRWTSRDTGEVIDSCAVITRPSEGVVSTVHDRMPVVLSSDAWPSWIDAAKTNTAAELLLQGDADLDCHPVSQAVSSPKNDDPRNMDRVEIEQLPLFS
ncbi:MAG: SOS response-associated peptidase [Polyangiaceae bacterium]